MLERQTADQAWPPYVVDLHAAAPRRKDLPPNLSASCDITGSPLYTTNMRILPLIVLFACLAWQAVARAQDEGEARPAASRGLLKRGLLAKGKATTTTTAAPQEEAEYEDDAEYPVEGEAQEPSTEAPVSSTEGKKLVAGGVRPFRSNTDLLEALKRRRAQAAEAKLNGGPVAAQSQEPSAEAPAKSSYSTGKKRFNTAPKETNADEEPAPAKPSRGRFGGRPSSRSVQDPEPEEQNDAAPSSRTGRTFRRGSSI